VRKFFCASLVIRSITAVGCSEAAGKPLGVQCLSQGHFNNYGESGDRTVYHDDHSSPMSYRRPPMYHHYNHCFTPRPEHTFNDQVMVLVTNSLVPSQNIFPYWTILHVMIYVPWDVNGQATYLASRPSDEQCLTLCSRPLLVLTGFPHSDAVIWSDFFHRLSVWCSTVWIKKIRFIKLPSQS